LFLLGANTPADCRKDIPFVENLDSTFEVAFGQMQDKAGDVDLDRASFDAAWFCTLEAALRLLHGNFYRITARYLLKILAPYERILFGHRATVQIELTFCHNNLPTLFSRPASLKMHRPGFILDIGPASAHQHLPINGMAVEFWAIDAGKFRFPPHLAAASTAHTGTIDHNRVE
jgi:hypothetical protein